MMNGADVNTLVEQGKRKVEMRKLYERLAAEKRKRENQAMLEAERAKFVAEAIEPLRAACAEIGIGKIGEINEHKRDMSVPLSVLLCTTMRAEFELWPSKHGDPPRSERTWKLKRYLVPRVELHKASDEFDEDKCDESWSVREVFWLGGDMEATEVAELDEALALASDRFVEFALLEQEAKGKNEAVKAERAAQAEREKKLAEAQRAVFYPFVWYVVQYAVVATDDEGNREADQASFSCLSDEPGPDGYFATVHGKSVKPGFITLVERMVCNDSEHLPYWCPTVETEWGTIRVPLVEEIAG
jgi:hypothetical protein